MVCIQKYHLLSKILLMVACFLQLKSSKMELPTRRDAVVKQKRDVFWRQS